MDFVDDECMAMFTEGQKLRMLATLNGYRKELVEFGQESCAYNLSLIQDEEINISPNPASQFINVELIRNTTSSGKLEVYDIRGIRGIRGIRVYSKEISYEREVSICTEEFSNGFYFVSFKFYGGEIVEKFLVTK